VSSGEEPMPLLSLFSGPGGLDLGFERAGFRAMLALDVDSATVETYNLNRWARPVAEEADLSETTPLSIIARWRQSAGDCVRPVGIIGGPPCQAFSVSNVRKFREDPRARLPLAYARILDAFNREFDLEFFVFENVAGLGHRPHASSLELFVAEFAKAGFDVRTFYLDAVNFGVPQYRNRLFIVGFNNTRYDASQFTPPAEKGRYRTVRETIGHLPEPVFFSRNLTRADIRPHPNHWCMNPKSLKFRNGALRAGEMLGRSFRMLEWDTPSWTVAYGHREVHVHPSGHRRLSVYEAMLLQGFPVDYELRGSLSDQIRLVSDAVPPPLAFALASAVREFIASRAHVCANRHAGATGQTGQLGFLGLQTASPRSTRE